MAEQKKPTPSTRKKAPAKRGPTKATALKALGLTQEDLNLLKEIQHAREVAAEAANIAPEEVGVVHNIDPDASENKAAVKKALDEAGNGIDQATSTSTFYVRNLRNVEVHFRLGRQSDKSSKRTNLNPRGQRGDLTRLEADDLHDDELLTQVNYGVVEIITAAEAKKTLEGQSKNQQQAVHPAMAMLRNELNQPYEQGAVTVTEDYDKQGVVVAHLTPQGGEAGELPSSGRGVDWNAIRGGAGVGGNPAIVSDGFAASAAAQADAVARRKGLEGPAAGLGGVQVVVEPTQKT